MKKASRPGRGGTASAGAKSPKDGKIRQSSGAQAPKAKSVNDARTAPTPGKTARQAAVSVARKPAGGAARQKYKLSGPSGAIRRGPTFVVGSTGPERPAPRSSASRGALRSDDEAMVERMSRYLGYSFERLDPETRRRAIAAVTPAETIAVVVHAAPEMGLPTDSALARALARGAQRKQELLLRAGGALTSGEVGELLGGITVQAVKARVGRRKLLAVPLSGGYSGFPAIQFDGTDVRPGLSEVLAAAHATGMGEWYLFALLMDPAPGREDPLILALADEGVRAGFLARLATYGEQMAS